MAKRAFTARYDGRCPVCDDDIEAGFDQLVYNDEDVVVHSDCYDGEVQDA